MKTTEPRYPRFARGPMVCALLTVTGLAGCGSMPDFEPNRMGAEHECGQTSASLVQYNACMERVEAFYREYESERKNADKDDG